MRNKPNLLTRRKAIQGAASLLGGTIAAAQLGTFVSRAAFAAETDQAPTFFDADQFALVERVADLMIPETDTPGALGVGVPHFVDLMMSEWASPARQSRYVDGLRALDTELRGPGGASFVDLSEEQQFQMLQAVDAAAFAPDGDNNFFKELKRMMLFAYYSSEPGATEELQYEVFPGPFRPCMDVDDDVRAWFHVGFRHGL